MTTARSKELPETPETLPSGSLTFGEAISGAVKRLRDEHGGLKVVAGFFDGRAGKEVAESTVSRWTTEPDRFPALLIPILVEISPWFRAYVFQHIAARMTVPAEVVKRMDAKTADAYSRAVTRSLEEIAPDWWGRK